MSETLYNCHISRYVVIDVLRDKKKNLAEKGKARRQKKKLQRLHKFKTLWIAAHTLKARLCKKKAVRRAHGGSQPKIQKKAPLLDGYLEFLLERYKCCMAEVNDGHFAEEQEKNTVLLKVIAPRNASHLA